MDQKLAILSTDSKCMVRVNGAESSKAAVLSGVSQGSVLGPLLFLIYIDDLTSVVQSLFSNINLLTDDILLYHTITASADYKLLQQAISITEELSVSNFLSFDTAKCKYIIISRKKSPTIPGHPLVLLGSPMQKVDCYKYLGLLMTKDLTWSAHITSICSKAKKILGLTYRRFFTSSNQETIKQLYISLVRPHLEYAACQV